MHLDLKGQDFSPSHQALLVTFLMLSVNEKLISRRLISPKEHFFKSSTGAFFSRNEWAAFWRSHWVIWFAAKCVLPSSCSFVWNAAKSSIHAWGKWGWQLWTGGWCWACSCCMQLLALNVMQRSSRYVEWNGHLKSLQCWRSSARDWPLNIFQHSPSAGILSSSNIIRQNNSQLNEDNC